MPKFRCMVLAAVLVASFAVPRNGLGAGETSQQPGQNRSLHLRLRTELAVWGAVAVGFATWRLLARRETGDVRWSAALGFEHAWRRTLRLRDAEQRNTAAWVSDLGAYVVPPAVVLTTVLVSSAPSIAKGVMPRAGLTDLYVTLTAFAIANQVNHLLKIVTARRRPNVDSAPGASVAPASTYSFPSGHTMAAFSMGAAYSTMLYRRGNEYWWVAALVSGAVGTAVGVCRMQTDVHWGLDVLGGVLLGSTIGVLYPALALESRPDAARSGVTAVSLARSGVLIRASW